MEARHKNKTMTKYKNGKIYKLYVPGKPEIKPYIGSTYQPPCKRKTMHRSAFNLYLNGQHKYRSSFDVIKDHIDTFIIEVIKRFPCENRKQLRIEEQYYIKHIDCCNKINAYLSKKDRLKYNKQYRIDHRNEINEKLGKPFDCECGATICYRSRARHSRTKKHAHGNNQKDYRKLPYLFSV